VHRQRDGRRQRGCEALAGLWISETGGAKFRLQVVTEFKNRGVQDTLIACVDGLEGFPDAMLVIDNMNCDKLNRLSFP
jgi:putative transposase